MLLKSRTGSYSFSIRVKKPQDIVDMVKDYFSTLDKADMQKEHLLTIGLDSKNKVKYLDETSVGTLSECLIHPRDIFRRALLKNACSVVMVHNHPSGEKAPSLEDIKVAKVIAKAGIMIGIPLMDSIVIGDGEFSSMKAHNLLSD